MLADDTGANSKIATASVDVIKDNIQINKSADKQHVNYNDLVTYTVNIENPTQHTLNKLVVDDMLPVGFIYKPGSATRDGQTIANNNIQLAGRSLKITLGSLAKGKRIKLQYAVAISDCAY